MFVTTRVLAFFKSLKFEKNYFFLDLHTLFLSHLLSFFAYLCTFTPFLSLSVCVGATGNSLLVFSDNFFLNCRGEAFVNKADKKLDFLLSQTSPNIGLLSAEVSNLTGWVWIISLVIQVRRPHFDFNSMAPGRKKVDIWNPADWPKAWQQIISSRCFCVNQGERQQSVTRPQEVSQCCGLTYWFCVCMSWCACV